MNKKFAIKPKGIKNNVCISMKNGFTLIEVLVASVILFTFLALASLIIKGTYVSSEKASKHVLISGAIPLIISDIQFNLQDLGNQETSTLNGEGESLGVSYSWQANLDLVKGAPSLFDIDTGKQVESPKKYKLWTVKLSMNTSNTSKEYEFKELSWNDS